MTYPVDAADRALARRFTGARHSCFAVLEGEERKAACRANYSVSRSFATPGEARSAERGYDDFPLFVDTLGCDAYLTGYLDAEQEHQQRPA